LPDPTPSDTPSDSDSDLASCSYRWRFDGRRWVTRRWMCVLYWSFLWRPQWKRLDTMCEMFQMGAHILCWYGGRVCLWALSGINTVLFLVCVIWICSYFVNIFYFLCKLFTSPN
jgi:hypothetical protein